MKLVHRSLIFTFLFLYCSLQVELAYSDSMKSLTIYEGLAGESVYSIYQTSDGKTWFGTTNGLTQYDGNNLLNFKLSAVHSKNRVQDMIETPDGHFYAASVCGLYYLDERTYSFRLVNKDFNCNVIALAAVGDTVYAATQQGLYRLANGELTQYWMSQNHLSTTNHIQDLAVDDKGSLWVLGDYELYRFDSHSGINDNDKVKNSVFEPMGLGKKIHLLNTLRVFSIVGDNIYIGTYNDGLWKFSIKDQSISKSTDVGCNIIPCISTDHKYLYVGTDGAGLSVIDLTNDEIVKKYDISLDSEMRLVDNTVYSFLHTTSGVNFFGYYRRGVQHNFRVRPLFHCYKTSAFDSNGINIRSLCIDGPIKVLGSRGGLYYVDEEKGFCKFFAPNELGGSIVTNVVKYDGQYYCCTFNGGVMRIDPQTLTTSRFGKAEELRQSSFGSLEVSPDNELWMSGNGGVFVYNGQTGEERVYNYRNSQLPDSYCNNLLFDRQGRCWISSIEGMCIYDPIEKTVHNNGFPEGFFNNLSETNGTLGDKDKLIFICFDGIFRTDEELTNFGPVNTRQTIGNDYVSQVIYDRRNHYYWIATERGLFRTDAEVKNISKYAQEVGLNSREFSRNAIYIDNSNRLWTGTVNGLYYVDLDEVNNYDAGEEPILLTEILVDRIPLGLKEDHDVDNRHSLNLSYHWGTEELSFQPLKLDYSDQSGECFEYRIVKDPEHPEGEWTVLKNHERAVIDDGLHIGRNFLQVRLAGQKRCSNYTIQVLPSSVFIAEILAVIGIIFIIALFWRQRRMLHFQRQETARMQQELEDAKRKYSRVMTTDNEQQRLFERLDRYMKENKPFLNSELKLSDIAASLDCSTVKISQLLNTYVEKNFYDFVNQHRLEEFKLRLSNPKYDQYTLIALAEECGFKRSSFFSTFKKFEGITPAEYVKKIRPEI